MHLILPPVELKASPAERIEARVAVDGVQKPYGIRYAYVERITERPRSRSPR